MYFYIYWNSHYATTKTIQICSQYWTILAKYKKDTKIRQWQKQKQKSNKINILAILIKITKINVIFIEFWLNTFAKLAKPARLSKSEKSAKSAKLEKLRTIMIVKLCSSCFFNLQILHFWFWEDGVITLQLEDNKQEKKAKYYVKFLKKI